MPKNIAETPVSHERPAFGLTLRCPTGFADNLLAGLSDYSFDRSSIAHYDKPILDEIAHGVRDLRSFLSQKNGRFTTPFSRTKGKAINSDDAIIRDQAVWGLASGNDVDINTLITSIEKAPTEELAISGLLAIQKVAQLDLDRVLAFLNEVAGEKGAHINLAEWASLIRAEIQACEYGDLEKLKDPISQREAIHLEGKTFDLTMPLIFQCNACTAIGGVRRHTTISPTWFKQIFGDAMACISTETFRSKLILEKKVSNLHEDGSPHYEHFPFGGTTQQLSSNLHLHNYWSQIYRPFYTSGRVEVVTDRHHVIHNVPMTFCRLAITAAYDKYAVNGVAMPESVRGIFFGYGHISPKTVLLRGLKMRPGDFQISSRQNPETGKRANTYFYGTFFGKLSDTNSDGKLTLNARPVHCDSKGKLDYSGKGLMDKDPVRPDDWS